VWTVSRAGPVSLVLGVQLDIAATLVLALEQENAMKGLEGKILEKKTSL